MKNKNTCITYCLSYDDLENIDQEIVNLDYADYYIPDITHLQHYVEPDFKRAKSIETYYETAEVKKPQNECLKRLKEQSLEPAIFYIKYLMWVQFLIQELDKEEKNKHKDVLKYIQNLLFEEIEILD